MGPIHVNVRQIINSSHFIMHLRLETGSGNTSEDGWIDG